MREGPELKAIGCLGKSLQSPQLGFFLPLPDQHPPWLPMSLGASLAPQFAELFVEEQSYGQEANFRSSRDDRQT